jgi:hypothetical protein
MTKEEALKPSLSEDDAYVERYSMALDQLASEDVNTAFQGARDYAAIVGELSQTRFQARPELHELYIYASVTGAIQVFCKDKPDKMKSLIERSFQTGLLRQDTVTRVLGPNPNSVN